MGIVRPSTMKDDSDHIVLDSGATSHMRRNMGDFEDDFVTCNDVFVLMGDNSEIPVSHTHPHTLTHTKLIF